MQGAITVYLEAPKAGRGRRAGALEFAVEGGACWSPLIKETNDRRIGGVRGCAHDFHESPVVVAVVVGTAQEVSTFREDLSRMTTKGQ